MMDVRGRIAILAVVIAGAGLTGCVSQGNYDKAETSARALEARNQELLQNNESLETMLRGKDQRISQLETEKNALQSRVGSLGTQLGQIDQSMTDLDSRLRDVRLGGLNPSTDRALRELTSRYPDLLSYDANRGMIRLGSDLTFDSGSDVVKPQAKAALSSLAQILNSSDAQAYDARVVGHTDSQPVTRSRDRHPNNLYLSLHRSAAVVQALEGAGVSGSRLEACGWGEFRPAVPNNSSGGTPANRRVEIYIVASSATMGDVNAATAPAAAPTPTNTTRETPMK